MNTDIVVFKNEFNTVPLRNFTGIEMDLLFTIMATMRDQGLTECEFDFSELKELSNYQVTATERFVADLERTYDKLIQLNVKIGTSRKWTKFVFFTRYSVDLNNETISIAVNPEFEHLINELTGNFTKLELEEVTHLKSSYSKSMYRLLKQFRASGVCVLSIEDFRNLLDVPESYKMFNIRQRVLEPILKELAPYFHDLEVQEIKGKGKRKRQVVQLIFTFEAQENFRTDKKGKAYLTKRDEDGNYYNEYPGDLKDLSPSDFKRIFQNKKPQQQVITENGYSEEDWDKNKQVD